MANDRNVNLGVGIQTSGQDQLKGLASDVRGLGAAAGDSATDAAALAKQMDALSLATANARKAEGTARTEATAAKAALDEQRTALERLRAETDKAGRSTTEYEAAERKARLAVVDAREALRQKQATLSAASNEARTAAEAERNLAESMRTAATAARTQAQANNTVGQSLDQLKSQYTALHAAVATLAGVALGGLARDLNSTAESALGLEAKLRIATGGGDALKSTLAGVYEVANRSGVAVDEMGNLVVKLITAGKELGITNTQALGLAETLTQALRIGGASAQEAAASVQQFGQSIAAGTLQGDELRSLLENSARLSKALADGLGVTVGQLKELGSTGALTSKQVIAALEGQSAALQSEFDQLPKTVSTALAVLNNSWTAYINQANQATGATTTAATAIEALARNLPIVAEVLYGVGKAALAYTAVKLGAAFLEAAAGARASAAATATAAAATTAHTAATVANTTAQGANAAATASTAVAAGRFASIISGIKLGGLLLVLTNLKDIGTAVGEGAAKWMGYGKAIQDAERSTRAEAETTRRNTAEKAALAQRTQQAADAALGLNKEARALVAEFEGVVTKTGDVSEALTKLAKDLRLSDVSGITAAGAALDALGVKGKLNGEQIKQALADALKGTDLGVFATQAKAAFDSSEQGARRLQAALQAVESEGLRRVGTSVKELEGGFSTAMNSALNDVDVVAKALRDLKTPADEAGRVLTTALDQALNAAKTEKAVQAVLDRVVQLGKEGQLTGEKLAIALEKAKTRLDDLKPGVNSLAEAFRTLGLKSREEMDLTAASFKKAWDVIRIDGTATLQEKIAAFARYREAAIAANKGVESGEIELQRKVLETEASVKGLGASFESAMQRAGQAVRGVTAALQEQRNALAGDLSSSLKTYNDSVKSIIGGPTYDKDGFATDSSGQRITAGTQLTPPDGSGDWQFISDMTANGGTQTFTANGKTMAGIGVSGQGYWVKASGIVNTFSPGGFKGPAYGNQTGPAYGNGAQQAAAPAPTASPSSASTSHTVTLKLAGRDTTINTATAEDASALVDVLRDLDEAARRA